MVQEAARLGTHSGSKIFIVRDFIYKEIEWNSSDPHGSKYMWRFKFLECVNENFLHQHVSVTRVRGAVRSSKLDPVSRLQ